MSEIQVGDNVYWSFKTKSGNIVERAGKVIGCVFPERHPNKVLPNLFSEKIQVRNYLSYLVMVAGSNTIFWPPRVEPLPDDKVHLLDCQKPVTTKKTQINYGDRLAFRRMFKSLGYSCTESKNYINVLDINKRLVFRIMNGVEFLCSIEHIKFY